VAIQSGSNLPVFHPDLPSHIRRTHAASYIRPLPSVVL
jgi:hypothetical protein